MTQGNTRLAIAAYTKSLALDPTNDNAKSMLLKLKANPKKSKSKK